MEINNVHQLEFPMTDEERQGEFARAQASCAYAELNIIFRAEQTIKQILEKYWQYPQFQDYAKQMGIWHHLNQHNQS